MEHTTHTNNEEQAIDLSVLLRRMLRALRRLWPVCLALIVLCAAVMGWRAHRTFRPMYCNNGETVPRNIDIYIFEIMDTSPIYFNLFFCFHFLSITHSFL